MANVPSQVTEPPSFRLVVLTDVLSVSAATCGCSWPGGIGEQVVGFGLRMSCRTSLTTSPALPLKLPKFQPKPNLSSWPKTCMSVASETFAAPCAAAPAATSNSAQSSEKTFTFGVESELTRLLTSLVSWDWLDGRSKPVAALNF